MKKLLAATLITVLSVIATSASVAEKDPVDTHADLHLIPWPKKLQRDPGHMPLTSDSRIVAGEEKLRPLAAVLAHEIDLITGLKLKVTADQGKAGDIVLQIDKTM